MRISVLALPLLGGHTGFAPAAGNVDFHAQVFPIVIRDWTLPDKKDSSMKEQVSPKAIDKIPN